MSAPRIVQEDSLALLTATGGARAGQHVQHALRLLANTSMSSAVVVISTGAPPSPSRPTTRSRQPCPQAAPHLERLRHEPHPCAASTTAPWCCAADVEPDHRNH
jgi:hypothetical protein